MGYATDKLAGGTGELGGSISHYGIKWNGLLLLDEHAIKIRQKLYNQLLEEFSKQYQKMKKEGNPYNKKTVNQAEKRLWRAYKWNKEANIFPQATELLGLFMEPENKLDIIDHVEEIAPGFPLYVLNEKSVVNKILSNNDELNLDLINNAWMNTRNSKLPISTYIDTTIYYTRGVDNALAYGRATSIVSYKIEGNKVHARVVIIDNWDHDKDESMLGFLKDAYILQQSKRKKIFAYKTTYDVTYDVIDVIFRR